MEKTNVSQRRIMIGENQTKRDLDKYTLPSLSNLSLALRRTAAPHVPSHAPLPPFLPPSSRPPYRSKLSAFHFCRSKEARNERGSIHKKTWSQGSWEERTGGRETFIMYQKPDWALINACRRRPVPVLPRGFPSYKLRFPRDLPMLSCYSPCSRLIHTLGRWPTR